MTGCLSLMMIGAGALHFTLTRFYVEIVPGCLPLKEQVVYFSGLLEVLGGIGLCIPKLRRKAGYGLMALLILIFPANINMAVNSIDFGLPHPWLWWRLPLQLVLIGWVWWCTA